MTAADWTWILIDPKEIIYQTEKVGTEERSVIISPYDLPVAARGYYNHDKQIVGVEFRYIGGGEKRHSYALDDATSVIVGKKSARLYGMIDEEDRYLNYEVAKNVIERYSTDLLTSLSDPDLNANNVHSVV